MIKTIIVALLITPLAACTENNQTVSTELTVTKAPPATSSAEQITTEADTKLIRDTIRLLDDKDFQRKSTDLQKQDKAQLTFTLIAPIDEMHSKWNNNKHPAAQPCQSALKLFNQNTLNHSDNKIDKETEQQYERSYKTCRSYQK